MHPTGSSAVFAWVVGSPVRATVWRAPQLTLTTSSSKGRASTSWGVVCRKGAVLERVVQGTRHVKARSQHRFGWRSVSIVTFHETRLPQQPTADLFADVKNKARKAPQQSRTSIGPFTLHVAWRRESCREHATPPGASPRPLAGPCPAGRRRCCPTRRLRRPR